MSDLAASAGAIGGLVASAGAAVATGGLSIPASLALTGIGAGVSAAGTIAGGANAASLGQSQQNADNYQAAQLRENASSEIGAAQQQMLQTQQKTRLAQGTLQANAAGSGFVASTGSSEAISQSIARQGSYQAAMNLFQGRNQATGMLNQAQGATMSGQIAAEGGQMQEEGSDFSAVGNLATAGGTIFKNFNSMSNPTNVGSATSIG
jgi:hypothetical protein